jgi:hypothetical protein
MKRALPLVVAAILYVVIVVAWIGSDKRVPRQTFDKFSAESTADDGLSLAFAYLQKRGGHHVEKLTRAIDATLPPNAVVVRAGEVYSELDFFRRIEEEREKDEKKSDKKSKPKPKQKISIPLLTSDEEEFVRRGGRIVLAVTHRYAGLDVHGSPGKSATKVFPAWNDIETIALPEPRVLSGDAVLRASHALYAIGESQAISRIPIGSGDVIAMGAPELFANKHIAAHLDLLTALIGDRRPVFFDEYVHGEAADDGALALMKDWNLGPFLLLLLFAFVLALWRNGVALGAREDDFRDTRSEAVDLVASLGALYDRSMSNGEAIVLYHQALTRAVAAQSGLRGDALHRRVDELTGYMRVPGKQERLDSGAFKRSLMKINEGFGRIEKKVISDQ